MDGNLYQVSSRVAGQVIKVYVEDNQQVKTGQLLAEIDPKDYQVALEQAQANLASAQAAYVQATVNVPITGINVRTLVSTSGSDVKGSAASVLQAQKQEQAAEAQGGSGQGECGEGQAGRGALHSAGAEGRYLEAAV